MSETTLIKAIEVNRYYGDTHAVKDLSFEIHSGDILGFLGPNGAGKSTTMQMISGSLSPSSGQILVNDIDLLDNPIEAKRHIGYLPEQPPLYKELTVDEYLDYCARLRSIGKAAIQSAIDHAKQRCGLEQVGRKLINNLSKGYQQRVGIAQAIIHNPAVIILDEPTVGLDPIQIREIRKLIVELGQQHGVILSTHILPEVQAVCNRVQIIRDGNLVYHSNMQELEQNMRSEQLQLRFANSPSLAELQQIDGIHAVNDLGDGLFSIGTPADNNAIDELVATAVQQGWGLRELTPQQRSLEQIFMELTFSDNNEQREETAA